jgi:hypothetical protein
MTNPGDVFFVGNADVLLDKNQSVAGVDQAGGGTFQRPFRTLDFAIGQCTANRGDVIFVLPGHAETYSDATSLNLDVAGIAVIGMGSGSLMPKFTLDTADTTTIPVSAANIMLYNCEFIANFLSIATCFTLTTAKFFGTPYCKFTDTSAALNFVNIVESTGGANTADGYYDIGSQAAMIGTTFNTFSVFAATQRGLRFNDTYVQSIDTADEPGLCDVTGIVTDFKADGVTVSVKGTTNINVILKCTGTTSTGTITNSFAHSLDTTSVAYTIASGIQASNVFVTGALATQGGRVNPNAAA